jgi:hypothetical protein
MMNTDTGDDQTYTPIMYHLGKVHIQKDISLQGGLCGDPISRIMTTRPPPNDHETPFANKSVGLRFGCELVSDEHWMESQ